jgi:hypothetical protein
MSALTSSPSPVASPRASTFHYPSARSRASSFAPSPKSAVPSSNQLAAPTASQCAAIALTISQSTVEARPRNQHGQRSFKGKQTALRGCWHTVQSGRLPTHGQTQSISARAAGSRTGGQQQEEEGGCRVSFTSNERCQSPRRHCCKSASRA